MDLVQKNVLCDKQLIKLCGLLSLIVTMAFVHLLFNQVLKFHILFTQIDYNKIDHDKKWGIFVINY